MRPCYFYLKPNDNPPNPEEIRRTLTDGSPEEKIKILKQFIKCLVNDDTYPPMIMNIITNIIPILGQHPQLKKVMLLYWEVIDKNKSPNDPTLKDEMFLACNSLRSDLLSHNEYLRGRTLRLVSRIMHKGVIEPLSTAVTQNMTHKSAYVRRNAVVCLYNIFCNFGSDIIGDIDQQVEEMLKTETDLSTKRNAFILLNKCNPEKAMEYLLSQISSDSIEDIGDILQLAILKVLKQKAREKPETKAKILKIINNFTYKACQSVLLECSITSLAISNSIHSIKTSLASYVNILSKTNELNVKKIILDKLETACKNSNYIEQALVEDLIKNLRTPSYEIKKKILNIATLNLSPKISELLMKELKNQLNQCQDSSYLDKIQYSLFTIAQKFPKCHRDVLNFITGKVFRSSDLSREGAITVGRALIEIIKDKKQGNVGFENKEKIVRNFKYVKSAQLIKQLLNIFGNYFRGEKQIQMILTNLQITIGPLPILPQLSKTKQEKDNEEEGQKKHKAHFKTKILQDGTYQTVQIEDEEEQQMQKMDEEEPALAFREFIACDSIIGGIFTRNVGKLLYHIRKNPEFNRFACPIMMILCSLLRNYEERIEFTDQTTIQLISSLIRKVINPEAFIKTVDPVFERAMEDDGTDFNTNNDEQLEKEGQVIEKNPSDLIFFRQLKSGFQNDEVEFDDEEVNEILNEKVEELSFIDKLRSMVQLTGIFDPIYAESFVTVNKYDLLFEVLLINRSKSNLLNIQVEFTSTAEILVLEKAQSLNLRPGESAFLRTQIRFTNNQLGSIYGYINFDNQAGIQQPYLITQQIKIDYMQYIVGQKLPESIFMKKWKELEQTGKEYQHSMTIPKELEINQKDICRIIEKQMHCSEIIEGVLNKEEDDEEYFSNRSFYGKSKLGEFFLVRLTLFKDENVEMTFTLRSKEAALGSMIENRLKVLRFEDDSE